MFSDVPKILGIGNGRLKKGQQHLSSVSKSVVGQKTIASTMIPLCRRRGETRSKSRRMRDIAKDLVGGGKKKN